MTYKTAFNPGDSPVVIDAEGRTIGGGEWGTVQTTDDAAKSAFESDRLIEVDAQANAEGLNPEAQAALEQTEAANKRHSELQQLEPNDLQRAALKAGIIGEDDKPTKTELLAALVRNPDAQVASKTTAAAKRSGKEDS